MSVRGKRALGAMENRGAPPQRSEIHRATDCGGQAAIGAEFAQVAPLPAVAGARDGWVKIHASFAACAVT